MRTRRWPAGLLVLAVAGVILAAFWGPRAQSGPSGRPAAATGPFIAPVILSADTHGAILLDRDRGELVGVRADGSVRWRDREMASRPYVSCLAQCPDAVGSGSADETPASSVVWHLGNELRTDTGRTDLVLWAASPEDALVLSPQGAGGHLLRLPGRQGPPEPVEGTDPQLFTSGDGSRAVLAFRSPGTRYHPLERRDGGWSAGPAVEAAASSACLDRTGERALLVGDHTTSLAEGPAARPRELAVPRGGLCALLGAQALTQRFTSDPEHGTRTTTQVYSLDGTLRWERADAGFHPARWDTESGLLALATDTALNLIDSHGTTVDTGPPAADVFLAAPGCLLVLDPDLHPHARRLTAPGEGPSPCGSWERATEPTAAEL
ncbi:hypothetical protein OHB39_21435 [Streptomyces sp. NBC_00047]|uniref:hypothetical protein n=1 Tax=Streptomyces sp. NBC_00047 TaxID=2975627 RepID=UPI002257D940|nr:hypothetical protein [Streptomyces sp. NBC_00047]MCX5610121.1 hypothetical protein [Streptomyces sp. NBC_00047]